MGGSLPEEMGVRPGVQVGQVVGYFQVEEVDEGDVVGLLPEAVAGMHENKHHETKRKNETKDGDGLGVESKAVYDEHTHYCQQNDPLPYVKRTHAFVLAGLNAMLVHRLLDDFVKRADYLSKFVEFQHVSEQRRHFVDLETNAFGVCIGYEVILALASFQALRCQSFHFFSDPRKQVLPSVIVGLGQFEAICGFLLADNHLPQAQIALFFELKQLLPIELFLFDLFLIINALNQLREIQRRATFLNILMGIDNLPCSKRQLHGLILQLPRPQFLFIPMQFQQFPHIRLRRDLRIEQLQQIYIILIDKHLSLLTIHRQLSFPHPLAQITIDVPILASVVMLLLQVMIKVRQEVLVYKFLHWVGFTFILHECVCVVCKLEGYKRKEVYIQFGEMNQRVRKFIDTLGQRHYSSAFVQHLVQTITENPKITTLQEIYEVIQKESQLIIDYFQIEGSDLKLLEFRNPLCFESIRDYFHTMTRSVYKKFGNDINGFKEGLKVISKELIDIMAASTSKIVKHSELILKDNTAKRILVYSYSRSIALTLKRLAKALEENLTVYVCKSGALEQGIKLYEELVMEGVKCLLINDNEIGYYIQDITCVLVGAQVILDNGGILNRAGTSIVALLAHTAKKPFYVFAESYKFLRRNFLCQRDIPQKYSEDKQRRVKTISIDLTPPQHITMFCTDNGLYNPEIIALELAKILK